MRRGDEVLAGISGQHGSGADLTIDEYLQKARESASAPLSPACHNMLRTKGSMPE